MEKAQYNNNVYATGSIHTQFKILKELLQYYHIRQSQ